MNIDDYEVAYALWIKCGIIQHACVSPDCRRMGIGTELVNLALTALKEEGINKVLLVAFKKNEKGNAFWESQGFTLRDDLKYRNKALAEMIRIDPDYLHDPNTIEPLDTRG